MNRSGMAGADLLKNAALLAVLWIAYAIVRGITAGDLAAATENARWIIDVEHALGLPSVAGLQISWPQCPRCTLDGRC